MATPIKIEAATGKGLQTIPNEEASALVQAMRPVTREQYNNILPELRARVFVITGVEDLRVIEKVRDLTAQVPQGVDWKDAKDAIAQELEADLGEEEANRRAGVLLRHHVNQVYQAGRYQALKRESDIFTHWEYLTVGDANVRDSHRELDGTILPANHPFWDTHFPPWEFGCRCRVRGVLPEEVQDIEAEDADKPPEAQRVVKGQRLKKLERDGVLDKGPGRQVNVTAATPLERDKYRTRVQDFTLPMDKVLEAYPPEIRTIFEEWAKSQRFQAGTDQTDTTDLWTFLKERGAT